MELLLAVDRDAAETLGAQIEGALRRAIRGGELHAGVRVPSTRDLAAQLGVSRRIVVDAYAQLAAEGYLTLRQGAAPRVALIKGPGPLIKATGPVDDAPPRYDLRPARPDVSAFPRAAWGRALRNAATTIPDAELIYGDPAGVMELRTVLAEYLGRVRGVVAEPERVVITNGYIQGLGVVCRALAARGVRRIGIENPSAPEQVPIARRSFLEPVPIPVDEHGLRVDCLHEVGAVVLTPAHQHPTGVVLTPERRTALVRWLRANDAIAIEDDYDAEYRYDRAAVGALQGLDPDNVVYCGSTSKTLAPALRMGWLVVPEALMETVRQEKFLLDQGTARIEQHALADFIVRGELDRHLRRMRLRYRARRDAVIAAVHDHLPGATVSGIDAGLHLTVRLPGAYDPVRLSAAANARRLKLTTIDEYRPRTFATDPTLLLGYAQLADAAVPAAIGELAAALQESRSLTSRP